jgi:hypothetical protein
MIPETAGSTRRAFRTVLLGAVLLCALAACGGSDPDPEIGASQEITLDELGRVGGAIYNEPERAEQILEEAGLSPEEFEERVRKITNDPVLSREYSRGFEVVARPPVPAETADSVAPPAGAADGGRGGVSDSVGGEPDRSPAGVPRGPGPPRGGTR